MRGMIKRLSLLAAALMIMVVPVLAEEGTTDRMLEQSQQGGKNECLLVAMNCEGQVDSIQQRIDKIRGEISRGTDVYTNDELRRLNRQLEEATRDFENLNMGG